MRQVKYLDIKHQLTQMDHVLSESLKEKRLNIAELNHECEKFKKVLSQKPSLKDAFYVVYSKYMKEYHNEEMFVFLDKSGSTVETVHGNEFWLYDMIKECEVIENKKTLMS